MTPLVLPSGLVILGMSIFNPVPSHTPHPYIKHWGSITTTPTGELMFADFDIDCDGYPSSIPDCLEEALKNSIHDAIHTYYHSEPRK